VISIRISSLGLAALSLLTGCAPIRTFDAAPTSAAEQQTNRMFHWREEARELHEMADHREREAAVLSRGEQPSAPNDDAAHLRRLAQQLRAAAQYADEQAQDAQRQASQVTPR